MNRPALTVLRAQIASARRGERTFVMGILNVTPDSFSDGGLHFDPDFNPEIAVDFAVKMIEDGADLIDIGGESTRPATFEDNAPLSAAEEMRRVLPVLRSLSKAFPEVPLSIDTYKAEVAKAAVEAGAVLINDISAFRADPQMASVAAKFGVPVCLMHLPGLPRSIPAHPTYKDVVREVYDYLQTQAQFAIHAGVAARDILVDPGIGFGKTVADNLELMRRQEELLLLGFPVLMGASRKSTIGKVLGGLPSEERVEGTAATVAIAILKGATFVRVHDVKAMVRVARMSDAIVRKVLSAECQVLR
ncbi:MAG: dihydropteroate synthase [Chthonomonadaceae bacterium]|nr:dihydropteroate synthase [Chthonomonadaceae bacterium]